MKSSKDSFAKDINFNKVLFLHMNRVAMSDTQNAMDTNVDVLESLLYPYRDDEYKDNMKKAKQTLQNQQMVGFAGAEADFTKTKFRELMQLAERNNLLLTKEAYGYDEEEKEDDGEGTEI